MEFERENGIGRATLQRIHLGRHSNPHVIIAVHEPDGANRLQLLKMERLILHSILSEQKISAGSILVLRCSGNE